MSEIRLQQKQKLLLSAQQILSSQLLQLPMLNLEQRIYEELQENPLLEVVEERKDTAGDVADDVTGKRVRICLIRLSASVKVR